MVHSTPRHIGGQSVQVLAGDLVEWEQYERVLVSQRVGIPLTHRSSWIREVSQNDFVLVVVRNGLALRAAFPIERLRIRSLPGHYRLRATSFGYALEDEALVAAVDALGCLAQQDPWLMGVRVEVFAPEADRLQRLEGALNQFGYRRIRESRRYTHSLRLDLTRTEDDLLASFNRTCRRFINAPGKRGWKVERVESPHWADRMHKLWRETFSRTGAQPPDRDWRRHVEFARQHPDHYCIMGTFAPSDASERSLVAFSCARNNVNHSVFSDGASTRKLDTPMALSYAPMWSLIRWARGVGCTWFDFGGISTGTYGDAADPRGGISDFKRRFSGKIVELGHEWEREPSSRKAAFWRGVSSSASAVRRILTRLSDRSPAPGGGGPVVRWECYPGHAGPFPPGD